jgi:hypothetical protein
MSNPIRELADADLKRARLDVTPNAIAALSDEALSQVSGGRVKTSDKLQKAVLDFIKG